MKRKNVFTFFRAFNILRILTICVSIGIYFTANNNQSNFSGKWIIKERQVVYGPVYSNSVPSAINVDQTSDSLRLETTFVGDQGKDFRSFNSIPINGTQVKGFNSYINRNVLRFLKVNNKGQNLLITTKVFIEGSDSVEDFTRVENWSLTEGGQKLILQKKSVEKRGESWEVVGVYQKQ